MLSTCGMKKAHDIQKQFRLIAEAVVVVKGDCYFYQYAFTLELSVYLIPSSLCDQRY